MTPEARSEPGLPARRVLGVWLFVLVTWAIVAGFLAPYLVERGYAGDTFEWLNGMFSGRDVHPLEFYLDALRSAVLILSGALVASCAVSIPWLLFPEPRRSAIDRLLGGPSPMAPGTLVRYAACCGLLSGGSEGVYLWIRQMVTTRPAARFHYELLWMAPLSAGVTLTVLGVLLALAARSGRGRIGLYKATFLFAFLGVQGLLAADGTPFLWYAEVVVSLGLAAFAARTAVSFANQLRTAVKSSGRGIVAATLVLVGIAAWTAPARAEARTLSSLPEARAGAPNLLLIILDTVRARSLSLYGYERPTTPETEAWAREGTVFDRALATSSWTLPSHASLFTGELDPVTLTGEEAPLGMEFETLAEVLLAGGYATAAFTANPGYTTTMSGLHQGFARFEDQPIDLPNFLWSSWLVEALVSRPLLRLVSWHTVSVKNAATATGELFDWLDTRDPARPFFAFVNLFDAHGPYTSPLLWTESFGPAPTGSWINFQRTFTVDPVAASTSSEIDLWVNQYDKAIAYIDFHIGRIRARLESEGLLDNTVVVITSDHGEMWGEKAELEHRRSLSLPTLHVPMVVIAPGRVPSGLRVETPVSIRDVPRTFGELAGIERLSAFPGASMAPLWSDGQATHPAPMAHLRPYGEAHEWWAPVAQGDLTSIVQGDLHFIRRADGQEELYHWSEDPDQERNLVEEPAYSGIVDSMRIALRSQAGASR